MIRLAIFIGLALIAGQAGAQDQAFTLPEDGTLALRSIQIITLITVLGIAPALVIMITCFPFMVTVLSILRQAIGLQQSPPNMLMISLALFLTYFVMEPVFQSAWTAGIDPVVNGDMAFEDGFNAAIQPFRTFMADRIDGGTYDALAALRPDVAMGFNEETAPLSVMVPSFMLSEIARAFEVGFLLFLPFLIIDLVVSAVLMSMGMMMVPPAIVSLPFKLAFFVVADGWSLISSSLVHSYF